MLTLLLDLDDTLLDTNMDAFIPAYFRAFSAHLAQQISPDVMLPALIAGTRAMTASQDPSRTLRQVFDEKFYPSIGLSRDSLTPRIEEFYDHIFPDLGRLTGQRPEAVDLVQWAFGQGYRVGIATDPLFPRKATLHRLRFAGLPEDNNPFALISSYENFHFTKSHAAYFAEFLGRLGWPDGPVLMVGNDAVRDLAPARDLGLATYWVTADAPQPSDPESTGRGSLADLRAWLQSVDLKQLEPQFNTRESILSLLTAAPASISSLLLEMPAAHWNVRPAPVEWSFTEVLCHLRDTELEIHQPRLQRVMVEDEPFLAAQMTNDWAEARHYREQDGHLAFKDYLKARIATLEILNRLTDLDWPRKARHSIFGPTTMQELVKFMATHDRIHIQQIWSLLHPPG